MYRIFLNILRYIEYLITVRPGEIKREKGRQANRVILPIIRKVMPNVIARQIVGVQPMTNPLPYAHLEDLIKDMDPDKQEIMKNMLEELKKDD